jgi:K+-sensing histidine kinase KdpD
VVAKITGTAPRQAVPDSVVRAAGEIELVDVTPEALRDRLARGHIYPADHGGTYHQLADEDIPTALLAFADAYNVTQLVLGATPRTWRTALRPAASIRSRVISRGGGLDVHIVTCTPTANGVPAAACEPHQRKRTATRQQNTSWPGRVRQAARWGPRRAAFG